MENILARITREIANLPDDLQVELFRTIARFPTITFPILEMTSNELAGFFESSRDIPLRIPPTHKRPARGESSRIVNTLFERRTRGTEKRATVEVDSSDNTTSTDIGVQEEGSEEEGLEVKVNTLPFFL